MSQIPKPRRRLTPCHRHPDILKPTGLCAPCLHERLSLLSPTTTSSVPELRRCKTFSDKNRVGTGVEPRRRSCEVRGRDSLFDGGDNKVESRKVGLTCPVLKVDEEDDENELESSKLGLTCPVLEVEEEGDDDGDYSELESRKLGLTCPVHDDDDDESVPEGIVELPTVSNLTNNNECEFDYEEGKTMKEFIDLELETKIKPNSNSINRKDFKEIVSSVLGAASIFSKKLRKWRKKDGNTAKHCDNRITNGNNVSLGELKLEDLRGRRLSCTQSEVGDFGLGRRSCDSDVRGSVLHGGRASIDCGAFGRKSSDSDPRFSIDLGKDDNDEPRASWDGYLVGAGGGCGGGTRTGPMVSVIENAMASVYGFDNRLLNDRCNSVKKNTVVIPENGKISSSPAAIGIFNGTKLLITEKELNEWRLNSKKDDTSSSFETGSKELGSGSGLSVSSSSISKEDEEKQSQSQTRQWSKLRSFLSLLPRRRKGDNINIHGQDDVITRRDVTNPNDAALVRSYSTSFGSRGSSNVIGSGRVESSNVIVKRRQEVVGYSPNQVDNGLLRFYLTPLRSRRRNNKLKKSHSLARNVLKLY